MRGILRKRKRNPLRTLSSIDGNHIYGHEFTDNRLHAFYHLIMAHDDVGSSYGAAAEWSSLIIYDGALRWGTIPSPSSPPWAYPWIAQPVKQAAVLTHELGHMFVRDIQPPGDRHPEHPGHDVYSEFALWPWFNGALTYHPNRWHEMMDEELNGRLSL